MTAPGLIIAAPSSGSGKTTLTLGLLRHLARRGRRVGAAKAGPDYIDPAFHAAAGGGGCVNLDSWAMRRDTLAGLIAGLAGELVVCEGVMGLFDGADVENGTDGSTAELAALTGWPVVLVVDARGQGASAAALVQGFARHRPEVRVAGVIFNRIGGEPHRRILARACAAACPEIKLLGFLPRDEALALPSRHLGLVQACERPDLEAFLDRAAAAVAAHVDVEALLSLAGPTVVDAAPARPVGPLGQRIAVARDPAFAFAYGAILDGWARAGAEIIPFSPLADEPPDPGADAVYLPGGYPELHAGRLAAASRFLDGLRGAAIRGAAIFGECGGYMVLGKHLVDADGAVHAMAGLLDLETSFAARRLHLGYRQARLLGPSPLGEGGGFRGHEFHYATILAERGAALFDTADAAGRPLGPAGLRDGKVAGSFVHVIDRTEG